MKAAQTVNLKFDTLKTTVFDYLIISLGAVVYALSVVVFTSANNIAPGGFTGIATMLNHLFSLPIGMFIFVMNIPLFVWGAHENGLRFLAKTIFATFAVSAAIDGLSPVVPSYTGDTMLAAIFGGILNGAGLGIVFYRGGSTGGVDVVALNLHKRFPFVSTGKIIMLTDVLVLAGAYFVYHSLESALYAGVTIFVSIRVIDAISYGTSRGNGKLMFIITEKYDEVSAVILNNIKRGVTLLDATGAYSGEKRRVIMCALRPQQVFKITSSIKKLDENAFIIVTTAGTIQGSGFAHST